MPSNNTINWDFWPLDWAQTTSDIDHRPINHWWGLDTLRTRPFRSSFCSLYCHLFLIRTMVKFWFTRPRLKWPLSSSVIRPWSVKRGCVRGHQRTLLELLNFYWCWAALKCWRAAFTFWSLPLTGSFLLTLLRYLDTFHPSRLLFSSYCKAAVLGYCNVT